MNGKSKSKGKLPLRLRCPTGCWRRLRVASSWTSPAGNRHRIPRVRVRFSSTSISYPQSKGSLGSRGHGVKFDGAAVADENPTAQGVPVRELRVLPALKRVVSRRERDSRSLPNRRRFVKERRKPLQFITKITGNFRS